MATPSPRIRRGILSDEVILENNAKLSYKYFPENDYMYDYFTIDSPEVRGFNIYYPKLGIEICLIPVGTDGIEVQASYIEADDTMETITILKLDEE